MDRRVLGWALAVVGVVFVLVSAFADQLGLGTEDTGIGWKQIVGIVAGGVIAGAGLLTARRAGPSEARTGA